MKDKIMEGNYTIADIQFLEGSNKTEVYAYACYDTSIVAEDICVVKSAHHGYGIAKVLRLRPKTDEEITREIVCKVDFSVYNKREAKRKRQEELKKLMAERSAKLQELALYEMLAKDDADMAKLLDEYKGVAL